MVACLEMTWGKERRQNKAETRTKNQVPRTKDQVSVFLFMVGCFYQGGEGVPAAASTLVVAETKNQPSVASVV
jgi:hypothetical protein